MSNYLVNKEGLLTQTQKLMEAAKYSISAINPGPQDITVNKIWDKIEEINSLIDEELDNINH